MIGIEKDGTLLGLAGSCILSGLGCHCGLSGYEKLGKEV